MKLLLEPTRSLPPQPPVVQGSLRKVLRGILVGLVGTAILAGIAERRLHRLESVVARRPGSGYGSATGISNEQGGRIWMGPMGLMPKHVRPVRGPGDPLGLGFSTARGGPGFADSPLGFMENASLDRGAFGSLNFTFGRASSVNLNYPEQRSALRVPDPAARTATGIPASLRVRYDDDD